MEYKEISEFNLESLKMNKLAAIENKKKMELLEIEKSILLYEKEINEISEALDNLIKKHVKYICDDLINNCERIKKQIISASNNGFDQFDIEYKISHDEYYLDVIRYKTTFLFGIFGKKQLFKLTNVIEAISRRYKSCFKSGAYITVLNSFYNGYCDVHKLVVHRPISAPTKEKTLENGNKISYKLYEYHVYKFPIFCVNANCDKNMEYHITHKIICDYNGNSIINKYVPDIYSQKIKLHPAHILTTFNELLSLARFISAYFVQNDLLWNMEKYYGDIDIKLKIHAITRAMVIEFKW